MTNYPGDVDLVDDSRHLHPVDNDLGEVDPIQDGVDDERDEVVKQRPGLTHTLLARPFTPIGQLINTALRPVPLW